MQDKSLAKLAFVLFLMTTATLFLRPSELFEWLDEAPIYEYLILGTLALTFQSAQAHFHSFMMKRQPVTLCVAGLFLAISLSHLQYVYVSAVLDSGTLFLKTMIYYALLITVVNSPSRLRAFMLTVAVCCTTTVSLCVLDFYDFYDFEFIQHLDDNEGVDEDAGEVIWVRRMRGTGIFQDPNDMAMMICATGVLCTYFLTDPRFGWLRVFWLLPMGILLIGLLATASRGGLLACGVAGLTLLGVRYGGKIAIVAAILGAMAVPVVMSRRADSGLGEGGTAQERVQLWKEGFSELKSAAILFGVGQGSYADIAGLVAHNSFIHAYVELGLFGGTLFFGAFFFSGMQLYRIGRLKEALLNPELNRMRPFLAAFIAGWATSLFSLSRCYVVPTYLMFGMMASYFNLIWIYTESGEPLVIWNRGHLFRLSVASVLTFVGLYGLTLFMDR